MLINNGSTAVYYYCVYAVRSRCYNQTRQTKPEVNRTEVNDHCNLGRALFLNINFYENNFLDIFHFCDELENKFFMNGAKEKNADFNTSHYELV